MNGGKSTRYDDKLVFEKSVEFSTLRGDVLKMNKDYKFITTFSPEAKAIINFMDGIRFDIHDGSKSLRDRTLMKKTLLIKELYWQLG